MEKLAKALSVIQQVMLRNNPGHVKDSVNEATGVLCGMLNTHRCLSESGVEIQKRLEFYPVTKKMGIFRKPHLASLGDTPKNQTKGEKRAAPSVPEERIFKKGKGSSSPFYPQVTGSQAKITKGNGK